MYDQWYNNKNYLRKLKRQYLKLIDGSVGVRQMADILTGAKFEGDYKKWISEVSNRFKTSQIMASIKVNDEMLRFYWQLDEILRH